MDLTTSTKKVCDIVKEAGEIAKRYFRKEGLEHHSKGGSDFVTKADLEVDQFLRDRLGKEFVGTQFLTEETAPEPFDNLKNAKHLWIIDPIDGTTNFSRGDSRFAISIALAQKGKVVLGVVYLPIEQRLFYSNKEDENAYCNEKELRVSDISDLQKVSLAFDWSWDLSQRDRMYAWLGKFKNAVRQPRTLGSASVDVSEVAAGMMDGYIVAGVKPWDIAAASLILQKAGGKITKHDGSLWNVFDDEIFASNGKIHDEILRLINA